MSNHTVSTTKHGVVGVIREGGLYLVIRRSMKVRAPGLLCFPGGHIEPGESFEQAIVREMMEELHLPVVVHRHLWSSVTRWGTKLEWMHLIRRVSDVPVPFLDEVSEVHWMRESELLGGLDVLGSVPDFFDALYQETFHIEDIS